MKSYLAPTSSVDQIRTIETTGPWGCKSGGQLNVLFALPHEAVEAFLDVSHPGFDDIKAKTGADIRGLRSYTVSDIPEGSVGGLEWHGVRTELVTAIGGKAVWLCEDVSGKQVEYVLDGKRSVLLPPGILHTYIAQEDRTRLMVVCNTLYPTDGDKIKQDTHSKELFTALQTEYATQTGAYVQ